MLQVFAPSASSSSWRNCSCSSHWDIASWSSNPSVVARCSRDHHSGNGHIASSQVPPGLVSGLTRIFGTKTPCVLDCGKASRLSLLEIHLRTNVKGINVIRFPPLNRCFLTRENITNFWAFDNGSQCPCRWHNWTFPVRLAPWEGMLHVLQNSLFLVYSWSWS
jgi:hypothetical protein